MKGVKTGSTRSSAAVPSSGGAQARGSTTVLPPVHEVSAKFKNNNNLLFAMGGIIMYTFWENWEFFKF